MHKICELENIAIENIQIETQRKKAKRWENETSSVSWGKIKSKWNSLRPRRGKKKKKKKCIGLAKMFVWVLHVAILSIAYYKKPKQTLANPIVTKTI